MILCPFHPAHLTEITLQRATPKDVGLFSDPVYAESLKHGDAFSMFDQGVLIACLGVFECWEGRGIAWAMFDERAGRFFPQLSLRARKYLRECRFQRVEAYIDEGFAASVRWAKLMGFKKEGNMRKFSPKGADMALFAWTKD